MKPKGLLFTLFILYWVAVLGVALFSGKFRNEFRKTSLSHFVPYGYSMFTPMTKTKFDVSYEFFKNGNSIKTISLQNYVDAEFDKGLIHSKSATIKSRVYLEQIYQLDLAFQKNQYAKMYNSSNENFDDVINKEGNLNSITQNLRNFAKLYKVENPSLDVDSVSISVFRRPMILPFNPNYKGEYTYVLGKMNFYETNLILPENR